MFCVSSRESLRRTIAHSQGRKTPCRCFIAADSLGDGLTQTSSDVVERSPMAISEMLLKLVVGDTGLEPVTSAM